MLKLTLPSSETVNAYLLQTSSIRFWGVCVVIVVVFASSLNKERFLGQRLYWLFHLI
jgi:hypothetical protein